MSPSKIREMMKEYASGPKLDIIVVDYASLYPGTMRKIDLKSIRRETRKRNIRNIFEPS